MFLFVTEGQRKAPPTEKPCIIYSYLVSEEVLNPLVLHSYISGIFFSTFISVLNSMLIWIIIQGPAFQLRQIGIKSIYLIVLCPSIQQCLEYNS